MQSNAAFKNHLRNLSQEPAKNNNSISEMKVTTGNKGVVLIKVVSLNDDKVVNSKCDDEEKVMPLENTHYVNNSNSKLILNTSDLLIGESAPAATVDKTFSQEGSVFVVERTTTGADDKLTTTNNTTNTINSDIGTINNDRAIYDLVNENSRKKLNNEYHDNTAFEFTDIKTVSDEVNENVCSSSASDSTAEQQKDISASSVMSYMNFHKNLLHSTPNNVSCAMSDSITQSTAASSTVGLFKRSEMYSVEQADALNRFNISNTIPSKVTLSWNQLTIRIKKKKPIERLISMVCPKKRGKYETILDNVKGIVQPGEMLALMGSR